MRRESRKNRNNGKNISDKIIMYSIIGIGILTSILVSLLIYSKNLSDDVKEGTMSLEQMNAIVGNSDTSGATESASTEIGKTVEESKNETNTQNVLNTKSNTQNKTNTTNTSKNAETNTKNEIANQVGKKVTSKTEEPKQENKELSFIKPVDGEISKEYAKDNLVYSETLKEWTTHLGVDIKADKTTVVKAAEAGTIKSIKNDPRYGLTVVIDHGNGYESIYANLLTSEFVVENEKVKKGQSIGTVGNTAVFEVADEPHLHFEIQKDSIQVDPNLYMK